MPKVSVIIPLYNQGHFLHDSVKSLQEQTFQDWQGVIINDGSTDDSLSVAEKIVGNDKRFVIVTRPNGGLSAARNTGIEHCHGEYVALLDSEDYFLSHHLRDLMTVLEEKSQIPMVSGRVQVTNDVLQPIQQKKLKYSYREDQISEQLLGTFPMGRIVWNNPFVPCAQLWRNSVIQELQFDPTLKSNEDWDILWRAVNQHNSVGCASRVVSYYRRHGVSLNHNYDQMINTRMAVYEKNLPLLAPNSIEKKCAELGRAISLIGVPKDSPHHSLVPPEVDVSIAHLEEILLDRRVATFAALWCGGALRRSYPGRDHFQFELWSELVKILLRQKSTYQIAIRRIFENLREAL